MDVFPMPPVPMRAMGVKLPTRSTIFATSSSRPKKALGGCGGDSPGLFGQKFRWWICLQARFLT